MTEKEAIELLNIHKSTLEKGGYIGGKDAVLEYDIAIKVFEEIQQYRAIGTVEECREAGERRIPKIPDIWGDGYDNEGNMIYDMYDCPNCGKSYEMEYEEYKYCPSCGQAIDWRKA